jgi:hypothetical protein
MVILFKKLKTELLYDSVIPVLSTLPKECKLGYNRDTCMLMYIAALFTIAKLWKQHRCPTTDEWYKKMWYRYTMEYYSAIKNEIMVFAGKWMELENIILSEGRRFRKTKVTCFLPYVVDPKTNVYTNANIIIHTLI